VSFVSRLLEPWRNSPRIREVRGCADRQSRSGRFGILLLPGIEPRFFGPDRELPRLSSVQQGDAQNCASSYYGTAQKLCFL